jgi:restriction endonuclease Mrr
VPIPDFQTAMLPLLKHLSDGKEHSNQETLKSLAEHFKLSEDELAQLLPSGLQPILPTVLRGLKPTLRLRASLNRLVGDITKFGRAVWRF